MLEIVHYVSNEEVCLDITFLYTMYGIILTHTIRCDIIHVVFNKL